MCGQGDGNNNERRGTSFPEVVEQALLRGWRVELWSWKSSLSAVYTQYSSTYPTHFSLCLLDDFFDQFSYVASSKKRNFGNAVVNNQYRNHK